MATTYTILGNAGILVNGQLGVSSGFNGVNSFRGNGVDTKQYNYAFEFTANCTQVDVLGFTGNNGTQSYAVSVDGGAEVAINGTGSNSTITLVTGLAVGNHLIRFRTTDSNPYISKVILTGGTEAITSVAKRQYYIGNNILFTNAPTEPSIIASRMTGKLNNDTTSTAAWISSGLSGPEFDFQFTGTWASARIVTSVISSFWTALDGASDAAMTQMVAGFISPYTFNNTNDYVPLMPPKAAGLHTVRAVWSGGGNQVVKAIKVYNGTRLATASLAGATTLTVESASSPPIVANDWLQIDSNPAVYEVAQVASVAGNVVTLVSALANAHPQFASVDDYASPIATASAWVPSTLSGKLAVMGDSVTQGANPLNVAPYTSYDFRVPYHYLAARQIGMQDANLGIQGQTVVQMAARSGDFAGYAPGATHCAIFGGINDLNSGNTLAATFQTNYQSLVNAAKAAYPGRPIYCVKLFSPLSRVSTPNPTSGLTVAGMNAIIQTVAQASNVLCIDISGGLNLSLYNASSNPAGDMCDDLHPTIAGQQKMANNLIRQMILGLLPAGRMQGHLASFDGNIN